MVIFWLDTGRGDVSYNSRRNFLCALPLGRKIAYHLYNIGYSAQNSNYSVKLLRKSKWHAQYSTQKGNWNFSCCESTLYP